MLVALAFPILGDRSLAQTKAIKAINDDFMFKLTKADWVCKVKW